MIKKVAILGSTGSIGRTLLKIIKKNKKDFEIYLLTANKNYKELLRQTSQFKVKNVIITDEIAFKKFQNLNKNPKVKIYNNFKNLEKIFTRKIDYTMSSILGINGLDPTYRIIKFTKIIAIANKESIICAWNLINKNLLKYKTKFIPVDSEHFSIWYTLKNSKKLNISQIFLTASGGPLLNVNKKNQKNIKIEQVLKHPNWKMGKKISIDSSTMMNKVFEILEAKNIFDVALEKLSILIHPSSYVHAIIKFNDGMIKITAHETTMEIPIINSLYYDTNFKYKSRNIYLSKLNNLNFSKINPKKYPLVKILKLVPKEISLFETAMVSANDELVNLYLNQKIKYEEIQIRLFKFLKKKKILNLKKYKPQNVSEIVKLNKYVRLKIISESI
jgi:1-deoxy-D-xylulose-5-phosphate reductoisomerase